MSYEHEVIRDLMPLCIDGIASPQSQKAVAAHIAECPDCAKEWDNMKNGIKTYESPPLPEDTPKYAETAKRVRKHHRWMLLRVTCIVIVLMLLLLLIVNMQQGARFTARGAAEAMLRDHGIISMYETPEDYRNAPKHKLTYIGEVTAYDGDTKIIYELVEAGDDSFKAFVSCITTRYGLGVQPLLLGMWKEVGGSFNEVATDSIGVYMDVTGMTSTGLAAFYTTDSRVTSVLVTIDGREASVGLNQRGFGFARFNGTNPIQEGTAYDADNNVLYTIQPIVTEYGATYYGFVSVE